MTRVDASVARRCAPRSAGAAIADQGSDGERALETQLRQLGIDGWVRELRFDEARMWRFDFAWPELDIAIEVEGGQWIGGHGGTRFDADCEKYAEAAIRGWTVVRVSTDMVTNGRAAAIIPRLLYAASQRRNSR